MAKARTYDRNNEQAARIILAAPERYAGLPLEWARLGWRGTEASGRSPAEPPVQANGFRSAPV